MGKRGGRDMEHETRAEAWSRWPQRRWAKEDGLKAILEAELIRISGGVAVGMRPQRLSDGWPVSKEGMECRREFGDRRGRATMGIILYGNILDFCYL